MPPTGLEGSLHNYRSTCGVLYVGYCEHYDRPHTSTVASGEGGAENARLENAGLELSAPSYRGWKMREWKIREREKYGTPHVA